MRQLTHSQSIAGKSFGSLALKSRFESFLLDVKYRWQRAKKVYLENIQNYKTFSEASRSLRPTVMPAPKGIPLAILIQIGTGEVFPIYEHNVQLMVENGTIKQADDMSMNESVLQMDESGLVWLLHQEVRLGPYVSDQKIVIEELAFQLKILPGGLSYV
jgi:hypothetical protein